MKTGILFITLVVLLFQNCLQPDNIVINQKPDAAKITLAHNKAILNNQVEAINSHNLTELDKYVWSECCMPTLPPEMQGLEGQKKFISTMITAFPDLHIEIQKETEIAEGDVVSHRVIFSGTNKGSFMEMAPTGKKISWSAIHTVRILAGKIIEFWIDADRLTMMQQLGAIPVQGNSKIKQHSFITTGI